MSPRIGIVPGIAVVAAAMVILFLVPSGLFTAATIGATAVMIIVSLLVRGAPRPRLTLRSATIGLISASLLYLVFYGGNIAITKFGFPGVSGPTGASIYALISAPSNPLILQVGVLAFDAAGYESFFRGALQGRLQPRFGRSSAAFVALLDAGLHFATGNLLWISTTFVADLVWGLTYYYGRDLSASLTSHFLWDIVIFIIHPIR